MEVDGEEEEEEERRLKRKSDVSKCASCGNEAFMCETGMEKYGIESLCFCNAECQQKYYRYELKRTVESVYDHSRRVFYTERVIATSPHILEQWENMKKLELREGLIVDLQRVIVLRLIEIIIHPWMRYRGASLISTSYTFTAFMGGRGLLYFMGSNANGQFGLGDALPEHFDHLRPVTVYVPGVVSVYTGRDYTLLLMEDGTLRQAGRTYQGISDNFNLVDGITDVIEVSCREGSDVVLCRDGTLWVRYNRFGEAVDTIRGVNCFIPLDASNDVVTICGAEKFLMFIRTDGSLWYVGNTTSAHPGNNTDFNGWGQATIPMAIPDMQSNVASVSCYRRFVTVMKNDGSSWIVGSDGRFVRAEAYNNKASHVSGLMTVMPILDKDSVLWMCLGNVLMTRLLTNVKMFHTLEFTKTVAVIKHDGSVHIMGANRNGQLGMGDVRRREHMVNVKYLVPLEQIQPDKKRRCLTCGSHAQWALSTSLPLVSCHEQTCIDSLFFVK